MDSELLSTNEAAEILGVHPVSVARWIDQGKLRGHVTIGGHRRIRKSDLFIYFQENNLVVPEGLKHSDSLKILIVDNDEIILNILAEGLKPDGYYVDTATDGFQAGRILGITEPDVVVVDIFMPGLNGFQVCEIIRRDHPGTKVIAITGFGSAEVKEKILKTGAHEYIEKPFEVKDLIKAIEKVTLGKIINV